MISVSPWFAVAAGNGAGGRVGRHQAEVGARPVIAPPDEQSQLHVPDDVEMETEVALALTQLALGARFGAVEQLGDDTRVVTVGQPGPLRSSGLGRGHAGNHARNRHLAPGP